MTDLLKQRRVKIQAIEIGKRVIDGCPRDQRRENERGKADAAWRGGWVNESDAFAALKMIHQSVEFRISQILAIVAGQQHHTRGTGKRKRAIDFGNGALNVGHGPADGPGAEMGYFGGLSASLRSAGKRRDPGGCRMFLIALAPPLWFRIMDRRLDDYMAGREALAEEAQPDGSSPAMSHAITG